MRTDRLIPDSSGEVVRLMLRGGSSPGDFRRLSSRSHAWLSLSLDSVLPHSLIHRFIREAVGFLVAAAEGVAHLEAVEAGGPAFGFLVEGNEAGAFHLVLTLHLLDHQLGIGDDAELSGAVFDGPLQNCQKAGVLGVVVGLDAKKMVEAGDYLALGVLDDGAVAGGAGIAARAAVAVGGKPVVCGW